MNSGGIFPSLQRRGGRAINKWSRSEKGADGVVARQSRLAMRFEAFACERQLLLMAAPCRACAGSARGLRRFGAWRLFINAAATPPRASRGGKLCGLEVPPHPEFENPALNDRGRFSPGSAIHTGIRGGFGKSGIGIQ